MSGLLRGRNSKEMAQSNTSLPTGVGTTFGVPEGVMAIDVYQNKEISGGIKDGGRKGIGSAICRRRANSWSINTKK